MAFTIMNFVQTICMSIIPIISGVIIESRGIGRSLSEGYQLSSLFFIFLALLGVLISSIISRKVKGDVFLM